MEGDDEMQRRRGVEVGWGTGEGRGGVGRRAGTRYCGDATFIIKVRGGVEPQTLGGTQVQ